MKVICIDDEWIGDASSSPSFNEKCTVENAYSDEDGDWYQFIEYPFDEFEQSAFIPLSDIDETKTQLYKEQVTHS